MYPYISSSSSSIMDHASSSFSLNDRDDAFNTPLHRAILYQDIALFTRLLTMPTVDVTLRNRDNRTPFALALLRYDTSCPFYASSSPSSDENTVTCTRLIELGIRTIKEQLEKIMEHKHTLTGMNLRTDFSLLPEIIAQLTGTNVMGMNQYLLSLDPPTTTSNTASTGNPYIPLLSRMDKDLLQCFTILLTIHRDSKIQELLHEYQRMTTTTPNTSIMGIKPPTNTNIPPSQQILSIPSPSLHHPSFLNNSYSSFSRQKTNSSLFRYGLGLDEPDRLGRTALMLLCNRAGNSDYIEKYTAPTTTTSVVPYLYANEIHQLLQNGCNLHLTDYDDTSVIRYTLRGITKFLVRLLPGPNNNHVIFSTVKDKNNYLQKMNNIVKRRLQLLDMLILRYKGTVYREDIEILHEYKQLSLARTALSHEGSSNINISNTNNAQSMTTTVHPADIARFISSTDTSIWKPSYSRSTGTNSSISPKSSFPSGTTVYNYSSSSLLSSPSVSSNKPVSFHHILSEDAGFSDSLRYRYGGAIICEPFHVLAAAAKQDMKNNNNNNNAECYGSTGDSNLSRSKPIEAAIIAPNDEDEIMLQIALLESLDTNTTPSIAEADQSTSSVPSVESNRDTSPVTPVAPLSVQTETETVVEPLSPLDIRLYTCRTAVWRRRRWTVLYYHSYGEN